MAAFQNSLYNTYKELKHPVVTPSKAIVLGLYNTYKELKQYIRNGCDIRIPPFI